MYCSKALDGDALHLDGCVRIVARGLDLRDLDDEVVVVRHLAEDRVLGVAAGEPVQEVVVGHVHEELGATGVGLAAVRHGERARLVAVLGDVLVRDVAAVEALLVLARLQVLEGPVLRSTGARTVALRVLGEGAPELVHEVGDHAVEVQAVVEAGLRQVDEVRGRDRHAVEEDLRLDGAHGGLEGGDGVRHGLKAEMEVHRRRRADGLENLALNAT
mmetsp:Transcript_18571/g.42095  ORF Transcript_18571/g.42095 Transcript_18571/m.42095 type:complete len:216 (+) Transcript_18571:107-754(+)